MNAPQPVPPPERVTAAWWSSDEDTGTAPASARDAITLDLGVLDAPGPTVLRHFVAADVPRRRPRQRRPPGRPRRPAIGLPALLIFAFAATFFAWVSATPLWLTLGHGRAGVATISTCTVHGVAWRCADFTSNDHSFSTHVTLLGPSTGRLTAGQMVDAQVVSRRSTLAYAGDETDLYVRWIPGVALLLLCGLGIAWATGARRLPSRRARTLAVAGSFAGPLLVPTFMLAVAW